MKISIDKDITNSTYGISYMDRSGNRPKLKYIAEGLKKEKEAVKIAKEFLKNKGLERGDEVWEVYGAIWHYTGSKWHAEYPAGYLK